MPSLRVMRALAVAAIAARPAKGFLSPVMPPAVPSSRRGVRGQAGETNAFSPVHRRSQTNHRSVCGSGNGNSRSNRHSGSGGLTAMMAKKKGGGKKKGAPKKAGGKKGFGDGPSSAAVGAGAAAAGGGGVGLAVAEADPATSATAAAAAVEENAKMASAGVGKIKNRAGSEQPVVIPPPVAKAVKPSALEAAAASAAADGPVNGGAKASSAGAGAGGASGDAGGATKGFGAPVPQPRPVQKGLNKGPKPMKNQQAQARSSSPPPPKQPGFDALAPGVPVTSDKNQRILTDEDVSEPENPEDVVRLNSASGGQLAEDDMSPADMLQYLRDNSLTIDLETMNPVEMPTNSDAKMDAYFPYPAANTMAKYSLGAQPKPSQFADAIIALLPEDEPWNGAKVRPLPEIKDFLLANRQHGGKKGMNVITAMMMKAMSEGDIERAKYLKGAGMCMTKAENAITGPFRQAVMFAENRLAPCMGSTVCEEYAGRDGADAAATWVVLKACVAEWELRLREIRGEAIGLHNIFKAMPNPTEGLDEERTAAITGSVQQMGLSFSNNAKLMESLPPVIRFMDAALGLNSTTEVRKYALQEFCPKEKMSPEELRFRVRSFITGLDQLASKSYHQLQVATADVYECLVAGTPDEYCLFLNNWRDDVSKGDPDCLYFQPYRLETDEVWRTRLREIVTNPVPKSEDKGGEDYETLFKEILPKPLWNLAALDKTDQYELPFVYLKEGWYNCLDFLDADRVAEQRARQAEANSSVMKNPDLNDGMEDEEGMDDIFADFMKEQEQEMALFGISDDDFEDDGDYSDIRDGPGPGMQELDPGFDGGPGTLGFGR
eukprot:g5719.t2